LGPTHHQVRAEHVDVLRVHLRGQPSDEIADACCIVSAHIIPGSIQSHDDTLMRIGKGGHRNRLVRAGAEAHAELFAGRLLEHGRRAKAQEALAGHKHLAIVIAGQDDRADAGPAQAGKEVEHQLLADVAGHGIVEHVSCHEHRVDTLGAAASKSSSSRLPVSSNRSSPASVLPTCQSAVCSSFMVVVYC